MPDAGIDGAGGSMDGGVDADPVDPVDPVPPGPFPIDPGGGEFAWVISVPGLNGTAAVAIDPRGNIFVAARQTGAVTLGSLHLPAPASGMTALVALKLAPDGRPIWGQSVDSAVAIDATALAVTPAGNVVIGGGRRNGSSYVTEDGFVMLLDGDDGATRWSVPLASTSPDRVTGIAAGPDAAGVAAIYAYGDLGWAGAIGGHALPAGAHLLRYDEDGTLRWTQSFPRLESGGTLALDPQRGPVIAGRFYGELLLGDQVVLAADSGDYNGRDSMVAGFHPDGALRFARQLFSEDTSYSHDVAVAPSGDIYFATESSGPTVVDDHLIPITATNDPLVLLRLTPEGRYASSAVITSRQGAYSSHVATDDGGAAYLLGTCSDRVYVQPEITCAGPGGLIVSYDADHEYRWATHVAPASVATVVPVPWKRTSSGTVFPSNRLIVVGHASSSMTSFGGVQIATQYRQLFIAALAAGSARLPSPLPAAPAISSVKIDGIGDRELRQGSTGTLVIQGAGLDQVTRARLGDLDVHLPAGAGTPGELRLPVTIPHGHAPGWRELVLGNAGGSIRIADAVRVTPVVVSPTGSIGGRGTFVSPLRLCDPDWTQLLQYGDELLLRTGVHTCNKSVSVRRGVTVRGESKAGTIVRGTGSSYSGAFDGFIGAYGALGTAVIENLTIESARSQAIRLYTGRASISDVVVRGVSVPGIHVDGGAAVTRFRYEQSTGTALVIERGSVDASQVDVSGAGGGVYMIEGTLRLADSSISSNGTAVDVGSLNNTYGTRDVTITRTTLRSKESALDVEGARMTVTGSTIELLAGGIQPVAIYQQASALTLTDSVVRGGDSSTCVHAGPSYAWDPGPGELWNAVNLTLDGVELTCSFGVSYYADSDGSRFRLRRSRVKTTGPASAVSLGGQLTAADLGTAASPGDNWIEAAPGHHALLDGRQQAGPAVDARGTTLNGLTFTGDVLGPVDVSGAYRIAGPNTIRF